jgi:hypothetical protein
MVQLAQKSQQVKPGGVLRLQGNLQKGLEIYRRHNGCEYQFTYAEKSDGIRRFKFSSYDKGYGKGKKKKSPQDFENYCDETQATASGLSSALSLVGDIPGRSFGASRSGGLFSWKNGKW